jgi:hypothetical protein
MKIRMQRWLICKLIDTLDQAAVHLLAAGDQGNVLQDCEDAIEALKDVLADEHEYDESEPHDSRMDRWRKSCKKHRNKEINYAENNPSDS